MTKKTKYYITLAVFILAILVVIVCLLSGAFNFSKGNATPVSTLPVLTSVAPSMESAEPTDSANTLTVQIFSSEGGTCSPSGKMTVTRGSSLTIYFLPEAGYSVEKVTVNGELAETAGTYTIEDIQTDMVISVVFGAEVIATPTPTPEQTEPSTASPTDTTEETVPGDIGEVTEEDINLDDFSWIWD